MAGLGISMLLISTLLTVVGYFGYRKYQERDVREMPRASQKADELTSTYEGSVNLSQDLTASDI